MTNVRRTMRCRDVPAAMARLRGVSTNRKCLTFHRVLKSAAHILWDKVICRDSGFICQTFLSNMSLFSFFHFGRVPHFNSPRMPVYSQLHSFNFSSQTWLHALDFFQIHHSDPRNGGPKPSFHTQGLDKPRTSRGQEKFKFTKVENMNTMPCINFLQSQSRQQDMSMTSIYLMARSNFVT